MNKVDMNSDVTGAKYLKMKNSMCFFYLQKILQANFEHFLVF